VKGVIHHIAAPISVALAAPPTKPYSLGRTDDRGDLRLPKQLAEDILQHIAHLHDEDEIEHQQRRLADVAWNFEEQERRHMADAIDRDHQAPLNPGAALKEVFRVVREHGN
jgi:hypothetical protein